MSMTITQITQIIPPPTLASNTILLGDIAALKALSPKELKALRVYLRSKELANDGSYPVTTYDPATPANVDKLFQDAKTMYGSIPTGDLMYAAVAVDWTNCKVVYSAVSADVNSLRGSIKAYMARTEDELDRAAAYLRLEIGE